MTDLCMVTFADLNVPLSNSREKMTELMTAIAAINDIAPMRNAAIVELADTPKKSSKRGLADEEAELQEVLWSLKQQCDSRWILPFEVPSAAESHSSRRLVDGIGLVRISELVRFNVELTDDHIITFVALLHSCYRRWSNGRIIVNKDSEESNTFATSAELALAGRPLTDEKVYIPLSKDLLLPESLDSDHDLRTAERTRPSQEAITAQKGSDRYRQLVRSMLTLPGDTLSKSAVILVNLTGYVEEMGSAASWLV